MPGVPRLTPGRPDQMLREAIRHVKALPLDHGQRADAFEAFAKQIENHTGGGWNASRGQGTDGSAIFLGRQGEGLVVKPDGSLHRGRLGNGIVLTPAGLSLDPVALTPLD